MNFTEEVKKELLEIKNEPCCNDAGLSAYIRGAGTLETLGGEIGFSLSSDSKNVLNYFVNILNRQYGEEPYNISKVKRIKAEFLSPHTQELLVNLGIVGNSIEGISVNFGIDKYVVENDCCKVAYARAMFLASGSISVPDKDKKTGYRLEFDFSNYIASVDFCEILLDIGLSPKMMERSSYVVYFNTSGAICKVLQVLGATKSLKKLKNLIKERQDSNDGNRRFNCDMSNISKQVNAFFKQKEAILLIEKVMGLGALSPELQETCRARLNSPNSSLESLAEELKISKSCLNHRLRKIVEIGNGLKAN